MSNPQIPMLQIQIPFAAAEVQQMSFTPSIPSASTSASLAALTTPANTPTTASPQPWSNKPKSSACAEAEGIVNFPKVYEMPEVPADYVPGLAAVLGGATGEFGNEGEGRDSSKDKYLYEVVKGFFKQNDKEHPPLKRQEMLDASFGMIDTSPERWENFKSSIQKFKDLAPDNVQYKVLFCSRHGQGQHNLKSVQHSAIEWEFIWARMYGDSTGTWGPDPELTSKGMDQALAVYQAWKTNVACGAPIPETFWVSPLTRTADTMRLSYGDLLHGKTPMFVEGLREIYGVNTCDLRRSRSYLATRFPAYSFEKGFAEEDPWWHPEEREQEVERRGRLREVADKLFEEDTNTYISLNSHSKALRSFQAVLNHDLYVLEPGDMLPIVVKATRQR